MRRIFRTIALALAALWIAAGPGLAAEPASPVWQHGLIWRDSPLAASFPLVVKTPAGQDFYLVLEDAETGQAVLDAGIEGGRFFRVLVPNGRYVLDFTYGTRGPDGRFGEDAGRLRIATPLDFSVQGVGRKQGHVVTLSPAEDSFDVAVKGQDLCQRVLWLDPPPAPGDWLAPPRRWKLWTVVCDGAEAG